MGSALVAGLYRRLPEGVRTEIDIRRRARMWRRHQCIFVHVPKAAGTSISEAIYGRTLGHFRAVDIRRIEPSLWSLCYTFAVLRDPLQRAVSAYRFAKAGGGSAMKVARPERYQVSEFASFTRFALDWLPKQDVRDLDPIFRPQVSYLCDNAGTQLVSRLYSIERMSVAEAELSEHLGRKVKFPHSNRTMWQDVAVDEESASLIREYYSADTALIESLRKT